MADSTRAMRKAIYDREILPLWKNRLLVEVTPEDLRWACAKIKDRGAPAARAASRSKKPADPLADKFEHYRKKAGLKAADFTRILHSRLESKLPSAPVKGVLSSAPKYLAS